MADGGLEALDDPRALQLIAAAFPSLRPAQVTGRYGGMDHHAVEVDGAWIFRFPKTAESATLLPRELRLLPAVGPLVPVAVPRYEWAARPTAAVPFTFAGYRKLAGVPALDRPPGGVDLDDMARRGVSDESILGRVALSVPLLGPAWYLVRRPGE